MAVYYLTIILLTASGWAVTIRKNEKKAVFLYLTGAFLVLVFLSSFRYAIGFDYFSYRNIYYMVSQWSFGEIFSIHWMEPLFFIACKLSYLAGCSYPVFLLLVNLFLMFAAMQFIYRFSKLPWVSVFLFICLQFLAHDMNLIRQSIAAAFFLLAYPSLKDRKILPYTLFILAGGLFHNSLLFVYPLYFLLPKKLNRTCTTALLLLTAVTYIFFDPLFSIIRPLLPEKYAKYLGGYFWSPNSFSYVVLPVLYCLLIYLFRSRIADPCLRTIYQNSALYSCIINLFITKHFILERFAIYPFIFSLTAIPEIIYSYKNKECGRKPLLTFRRTLLLFLTFGLAYFTFSAANGYHHVYPYISLLKKSCSAPN